MNQFFHVLAVDTNDKIDLESELDIHCTDNDVGLTECSSRAATTSAPFAFGLRTELHTCVSHVMPAAAARFVSQVDYLDPFAFTLRRGRRRALQLHSFLHGSNKLLHMAMPQKVLRAKTPFCAQRLRELKNILFR